MQRTIVSSSNIRSIGYEATTSILEVEFSSGDIYRYYGVPQHLYEQFIASASPGAFLNDRILRYNYRYQKQ